MYANGVKVYHFKAKDSETKPYPLFFIYITKDFTVDNMKKIGLNGKVYRVPVDYNTINFSNVVAIHKYLMKDQNIAYMLGFIYQPFIVLELLLLGFGVLLATKCSPMTSQPCATRPKLVDINPDEFP